MDKLKGTFVFFKIDLRFRYHQIRVKKSDIPNTTFKTRYDHYVYVVMSFGKTNAPIVFMEYMNMIFKPFLDRFVMVFIDNILIYSGSLDEHKEHLRLVLEVLSKNQLYVKLSKCDFWLSKDKLLGHVISIERILMDPTKVEIVM
uniref:Retrovirus-related Pol polyprotein from transposon 17.6 n=1 Tax=Cajanus cajan TaxID=3821 RepID=A0A151S958_CAJCA|nr:Retrovirus-related Pol polyprotein from transposon 17.6 [Cajanus cajan]KYP51390.1 Retrovirus-related Pol polyprotein from transposon 17.6 [Cajanus cajan]